MNARFSVCLFLICASAFPSVLRSQTSAGASVLPPAREGLVPVHWPDLTRLEAEVREQLTSLQDSLTATLKDPKTPQAALSEAYGLMGQIYHAHSLFAPARECYLNATSLKAQDFRWVYLLGRLDQQEDRVADAIRWYSTARRLQPDYLAVPVNLGNIYLQLDRLVEASESFEAALTIEGGNPAASYGLGQVALAQRRYADAVRLFEGALAQVPGANRIHYALAMAHRGLGDVAQAQAHLARQGTVGVRPVDPVVDGLQELIQGERIHLLRGQLAVDAKRLVEATGEFRKAVAAKPDSLVAHLKLGTTLWQAGDVSGASAEFKESLRLDPTNTVAHFNLALLLANDNKHEQAIAHLQAVFSVDPHDVDAHALLAQELLRSQRWDEALMEYSRVALADPSNETALLAQVTLLQRKGQYRPALERLEKSHAQFPDKGLTAATLAYLLAASPQLDARDGGRALDLATRVHAASGLAEHGAIVAMALGELGRCSDAAAWQKKMMAVAEKEGRLDLQAKLRTDLERYLKGQPCRPPGGTGTGLLGTQLS
jgi:tetratricopeptide (TPR) repeat protein